ncbi:MAG: hypothetical protein IJ062_08835 [Firmicutes bacterium]|nr:hypothetical protein [Bacillota bacterium]
MSKKAIIIINLVLTSIFAAVLITGAYNSSDKFLYAVKKELKGTGIVWESAQLQGEYTVLVTKRSPEEDIQRVTDAIDTVIKSENFDDKKDNVTLCVIHENKQRKKYSTGRFDPEYKLMLKYKDGKMTGHYLYEPRGLGNYDIDKLFSLPCFQTIVSTESVPADEVVLLPNLEEITFYDTSDVDISKLTVLKKLKRINVNHGSPVNCEYLAEFPELELAYLHPAIPNDEEFDKAERVRIDTGRDIRYVK